MQSYYSGPVTHPFEGAPFYVSYHDFRRSYLVGLGFLAASYNLLLLPEKTHTKRSLVPMGPPPNL
jgi:hypothetical protein